MIYVADCLLGACRWLVATDVRGLVAGFSLHDGAGWSEQAGGIRLSCQWRVFVGGGVA